ncbi:MAG: ABC transporter permease [Phycisphaerales bacterium]
MSFLFAIIKLGLHNLRLHKLRSLLTSLGIILGVAAVIFMVSVGEGSKQAALRNIQKLGATNVILRSVKPPASSNAGGETSFVVAYGLRFADMRRIEEFFPDAAGIVPLKAVGSEISAGGSRTVSQVFGTMPSLIDVTSLRVERGGRYITHEDIESKATVAVIGSEVAQKLFRLVDPVGADFRIDDRVFRVVGVLQPVGLAAGSGSALVGRDLNNDVHVPITAAEQMFGNTIFRRESGSFTGEEVELSEIYITSPSTETVEEMAQRARRLMEVEHPGMRDVKVIVPWELLEQAKREQMVWNIVLTAIASVSLLVGGIGIMNIMLASVTERTREIGIRRALGATRRHIVLQFLVETGALSALGGLVGIGLGIGLSVGVDKGLPKLLEYLGRWWEMPKVELQPQVTLWSVIISFVVAASIGLIFGIYPAIIASRKDPIVALRHD